MSPRTPRSPRTAPRSREELELEQEVDFGRYFRMLARRWWLLAAGLAIGALLGVGLTVGQDDLYRAKATIYLGQPLSATGTAQIQSLNTNPTSVTQLARNAEVISQAARESGLSEKKLRAGISTATVQGFLSKQGQTPLANISVKADAPPAQVAAAANALAEIVLERNSEYPREKIAALESQIASHKREIASIDRRLEAVNASLASDGASATLLEQRRGSVSEALQQAELLLVQARTVELGQVTGKARAIKTTARSRKNALVVGAALGLLIGGLIALTLPGRRPAGD